MIQIFLVLTLVLMDVLLIIGLYMAGMPNGAVAAEILGIIIFAVWGGALTFMVTEEVGKQAEDLRHYQNQEAKRDSKVEELSKDKEAHEKALTKYKGEVETTLLETYKQFEESIMEKIKDSKLLAMVMKKSGYSDLLARYHSNIIELTDKIKGCDVNINAARNECEVKKLAYARKMLVRQGKGMFGFHCLFPRYLIFKQPEDE